MDGQCGGDHEYGERDRPACPLRRRGHRPRALRRNAQVVLQRLEPDARCVRVGSAWRGSRARKAGVRNLPRTSDDQRVLRRHALSGPRAGTWRRASFHALRAGHERWVSQAHLPVVVPGGELHAPSGRQGSRARFHRRGDRFGRRDRGNREQVAQHSRRAVPSGEASGERPEVRGDLPLARDGGAARSYPADRRGYARREMGFPELRSRKPEERGGAGVRPARRRRGRAALLRQQQRQRHGGDSRRNALQHVRGRFDMHRVPWS